MNITYHIDDIEKVAKQILAYTQSNIFILDAPMGAGKTTLITAICKELGVQESISSPTFSIVNEYKANHKTVLHFDLYRIEQEEELFNIGIEDYLSRNAIFFIEWPDLVMPYLENFTRLKISIIDHSTRTIELI
ncbi:tRNA (adenosine(37)-N6)-threonylcarbamoyltransferase complex ATPase subunit type 1 TsaE [Nonlabens sp.]|uniref:tRNA (adenosine(37)-N6)-threonylcarbamoyltransferase complex ATPase subunit type 1 TsaE n=1 Tax=Nonlabens sp. TaxID=1888209 RepID=UPI003F69FD07